MNDKSAVDFIEHEFKKRKSNNPSYSLRAYAKNLGISPAILSQILNGKKELTPKVLSTIAPKLNLDNDIYSSFLDKQVKVKKERNIKSVDKNEMRKLDMETFNVISDWYHYAILELFYLDDFESDINWIAKKLKLSVIEVEKAIENLKSVRLINEEDGQLVPTDDYTVIDEYHFTSMAMRERQKQVLKLSAKKIEELNTNYRDHSSITITIDPALIPEIKDKIKVFRRSLGNFIAKNSKNNKAVYEIQISFFPITEIE